MKKVLFISLAVILALSMGLIGCEGEGEGEGEGEVRTTGPYVDTVIITEEPNHPQAISRLQADDIDVFAYGLADADLYATVQGDADLTWINALGSFDELTLNPVGPVFNSTGKLNPCSVPAFREAINWLIDRDYIADELMGGLGVPRYTCMSTGSVDYTLRFPTEVAAIEAEYAYDFTAAETAIDAVMTSLNCTQGVDDIWEYEGEDVELTFLIRTEDEREDIGNYVASQLEDCGFVIDYHYGLSGDLSGIWLGDPSLGLWHLYTGGWVSTVIPLDESYNFGDFYTPLGWPGNALWEAYTPESYFFDAAEALYNSDFTTMGERADLITDCLDWAMEDSARVFVVDEAGFSPMRADVRLAHDAFGGVYGSWVWAYTAHFIDGAGDPILGGTMRIATGGILTQPWNPVAGSNWVYEMFPIRSTGDLDTVPDTQTGLRWPGKAEKAEVVAQTGKPIEVGDDSDWCELSFQSEIVVPLDAWADWDATAQEFETVQDVYGSGDTTCARMTRMYYPEDIFMTPLHDGSNLTAADFIMRAIIEFDRSDPASAIYDPATVVAHDTYMAAFKAVKYITDDPDYGMIVEFYTDQCPLNAELAAYYEETRCLGWPEYDQGPGMWHTVGLGVKAEADGLLAYSEDKADDNEIEWTSFIAGPSIPILKDKLDEAIATSWIPYEPTLGDYVTTGEADARWSNLSDWYDEYGHFWVNSGPFWLFKAFTVEKVIELRRFEAYPGELGKFDFLIDM